MWRGGSVRKVLGFKRLSGGDLSLERLPRSAVAGQATSANPSQSMGLRFFLDLPVSLSLQGVIQGKGGASTKTERPAFQATVSLPGSLRLTVCNCPNLKHKALEDAPPLALRAGEMRSMNRFPNRYGIASGLTFAGHLHWNYIAVVAFLGFLLPLRIDSRMCKGFSNGTLFHIIPSCSRSNTTQGLQRLPAPDGLRDLPTLRGCQETDSVLSDLDQ